MNKSSNAVWVKTLNYYTVAEIIYYIDIYLDMLYNCTLGNKGINQYRAEGNGSETRRFLVE